MKQLRWMTGVLLLALCGCGNFFTKQTSTSTGTGTGTTTTNTTAGDVLYVADLTASNIAAYTVSSAGALTAVSGSPYAPGEPPTSMALTPGNTFLYVSSATGILGYSIGAGGVLTALNSSQPLETDVPGATTMAVDTTGNYLFAGGIDLSSGTNTPEVGVYQINTSTGTLAELTNSPVAVTNGNGSSTSLPTQLYVAPNDAYVYLTLGSGGTEILNFSASSGLGDNGDHINLSTAGTSQNDVVANAGSTQLFMTETGAGVRVFNIGTNGVPSAEISGSPFKAGTGARGIALNAAGTDLYVTNKGDGTISGFSVAATGTVGTLVALTGSPYTVGSLPLSLSLDQSGTFLAVANSGGTPDLGVYSMNATTGALTGVGSATLSTSAAAGSFLVIRTNPST